MPSFGILCAAMFRFERERVLHCSLYRGTMATYPVSPCTAGRRLHPRSLPTAGDGSRIHILFPYPKCFFMPLLLSPHTHTYTELSNRSMPPVPRYRSKWQDHVGTSALRCRPLASYVPLCSDLSGSASCTAPCIAGRQLHIRSLHAMRNGGYIPGLCMQCGTAAAYPVSACSAGRQDSHNMA